MFKAVLTMVGFILGFTVIFSLTGFVAIAFEALVIKASAISMMLAIPVACLGLAVGIVVFFGLLFAFYEVISSCY